MNSLNRSFDPSEAHAPFGRTLIQISTDEKVPHLIPPAPGQIGPERMVKEWGDVLDALCGKSFLPADIMAVGPTVPEQLAVCEACLRKAEGLEPA